MKRIKHLLTTIPFSEEERNQLISLLPETFISFCDQSDKQDILSKLADVDVALLNGDIFDGFLDAAHSIRWIHCNLAGLNHSCKPEVFQRKITLTGASGRSSEALAEHVFFFMLSLSYHAQQQYVAQKQHQWGFPGNANLLALNHKTIFVLGMGGIGKAVAHLAKAFYMHVIGYSFSKKEKLPDFDEQYCYESGDAYMDMLPRADYVVIALPLSDYTYHMFTKEQFSAMKKTAYFINISRGAIVDEDDLAQALYMGEIAGAGLDTFMVEPLPRESALWDAPNTVITPHSTPSLDCKNERAFRIICDNIENYLYERPMLNQATERDLFTKY